VRHPKANSDFVLAHDAGEGAAGGGVEAFGHAAGEVGFAAGADGFAHGFGHEFGVLRFGDGGIHEEAVGAEFHGLGGVGRGADSGVDDHGDFGDAFAENAEVGGILNAEAGADRSGEGHYGGGAGVDEFARGDEIVVRVWEDDEAFFDEDARGFDETFGVWKKSLLVPDDFEFDPVGEADFPAEARGADGFVCGVAGGGVGQDEDFVAVDVVEERLFGAVGEIDAANRDRDHVGARSFVSAGHFLEAAIFTGANDEAGAKCAARYDEFVCHCVPQRQV
jgi:hypothetical protein